MDFYQLPITQFLLGDSFHPGGLKLTKQLAQQLLISRESRVLDIASGRGTSSLYLAEQFGCEVVALDLSEKNLTITRALSKEKNLSSKITTTVANAEKIPFNDNTFDAIICECAVCTFEAPQLAANEMFRVLKPNAKIGISDVVLNQKLPRKLDNLFSTIFCIKGALSSQHYVDLLQAENFKRINQSQADWAIAEIVEKIKAQSKLLDTVLDSDLLSVPSWLNGSEAALKEIEKFIAVGGLGYMVMTAKKPSPLSATTP